MDLLTLIIFGSFIVFITCQRTFLHFSRTARRIFWYCLSVAVGIWLVQWLQTVEGIGMVWVILSAVLAASVVEDEMLKKRGLTPLNIEATHRLRAAYRTPEAQGKAERVMDIIATLTRGKGYTAGTKQLLERATGTTQRYQKMLHDVLESATEHELNFILCAVNSAAMVEVAHRHTISMLVGPKLPMLSTVARAAIIDGLQKLGLRYRTERQSWVKKVILGTPGIELTHLKAYIDDGGDYHSMYKLMYNDLQGTIQDQVLKHLAAEGEAVKQEFSRRAPSGPPGVVLKVLSDIDDTLFSSGGSFPAGVDALYPRKCYYPGALAFYAELDRCFAKQYGKHIEAMSGQGPNALYGPNSPSALEKLAAQKRTKEDALCDDANSYTPTISDLKTPRDAGTEFGIMSPRHERIAERRASDPAHVHHQEGSNLIFLSARPESYKGLTESESYRKYFQPLVARGDLDTSPTMLLGSLDSGPKALWRMVLNRVFSGTADMYGESPDTAIIALYQTLATKKLSRFREYAIIYPEAVFVFVGDNGQGDVLCAELLWSSMKEREDGQESPLLASFFHRVGLDSVTLSMLRTSKGTQEDWKAAWAARNISFHQSHVGMAAKALTEGLLDAESLHNVAAAARCDFRRIAARYGERHSGRNLSKALHRLNEDISAANSLLPQHLRVDVLDHMDLISDSKRVMLDRESSPSEALSDVSFSASFMMNT